MRKVELFHSTRLSRALLCAVWVVVLVTASNAAHAYTNVSVAEAHQMWQDGVFVLDVRTTLEFVAGRIPGAYNIPNTELAGRIDEIIDHQDDDILVYCHSGARSAVASGELETTHGFTGVHNMLGGFSAWTTAGYETAEGEPEPPAIEFTPAAGMIGLSIAAAACALSGARVLRKKK